MKPEEIVSLMNGYLTSMSEAIERAGGFVDKYVGDAIVAIFGAPVRSADHAIEAVAAALDCQHKLEAFNRDHASPIQHRIGLNTGEALIGNIGSRRRFNYTAFGDNVNLASRLEQVNTSFGSSILAAESVVTATGAPLFGARSTLSAFGGARLGHCLRTASPPRRGNRWAAGTGSRLCGRIAGLASARLLAR